ATVATGAPISITTAAPPTPPSFTPAFAAMHAHSRAMRRPDTGPADHTAPLEPPPLFPAGESIALPAADRLTRLAFVDALRRRESPGRRFSPGGFPLDHVAALLSAIVAPSASDFAHAAAAPRVHLFGVFADIPGLPEGAYRYDAAAHRLVLVRTGDVRAQVAA